MSSSNVHDQLPSEELRRSRRLSAFLGVVGIVDAAVTFTYGMINGLLDGGATGWDCWVLIFQVLHMWSWAMALSGPAISDAGSVTYLGMTFAVYVLATVLDMAGVVTRVGLVQTGLLSWNTFEIVCLCLTILLVIVDAGALLFVSMLSAPVVAHRRKLQVALGEIGRRSRQPIVDLYDQLRRVPETLRFSREQHRQLVLLQFILWIALAIFFFLGLTLNTTFQQLYWAQIVAGFLWPFGYALAEGVHNYAYLWFYLALISLDAAGSIFAQVWRAILLGDCIGTSSTGCSWFSWAGWLTFLLVMAEIVLDVYLLFLVYVAIRQTQRDRARVEAWKREALPERIRLNPIPGGVLEQIFASPAKPDLPGRDDDDDSDEEEEVPRGERSLPPDVAATVNASLTRRTQAARQRMQQPGVAHTLLPPAAQRRVTFAEPDVNQSPLVLYPSYGPMPPHYASAAAPRQHQRRRYPVGMGIPMPPSSASFYPSAPPPSPPTRTFAAPEKKRQ